MGNLSQILGGEFSAWHRHNGILSENAAQRSHLMSISIEGQHESKWLYVDHNHLSLYGAERFKPTIRKQIELNLK